MPSLPEVLHAGPVELRRHRASDLDALLRAIELSQPELGRFLPWANPMPSADAEQAFLADAEARFDADLDWGYLLFEPFTRELVGGAGLHPREPGTTEIGYWVRSDRTRRGYATAAAGALTTAAFRYLPDVTRVVVRMDQANHASAAVPRKLGYRLEGEETIREIVTPGHTAKGWVWVCTRAGFTSPDG